MKKPVTIVDIPAKMQRFYGSGKMLHPEIEMVEVLLGSIPYGKISLISSLGEKLAFDYGVDVTCPMRTTAAVKKIAEAQVLKDKNDMIPFWRVIRNNHLLINSPYTDTCAAFLKKEGVRLNATSKGEMKVVDFEKQLFRFS